MTGLNTELYRRIFEEGTLKTKAGNSVSKQHVLHVLRAVNYLCKEGKNDAIAELLDLGENDQVSNKTIEDLGISAPLILSRDGRMLPDTSKVMLDVCSVYIRSMTNDDSPYFVNPIHYTKQIKELAKNEGCEVSWGNEAFSPTLTAI